MARKYYEKNLIDYFKNIIKDHKEFGINNELNWGRDNEEYADIEYIASDGTYYVIEAKSHESKDKYNTIHKIFGQLLKEQGKNIQNRSNAKFCALFPLDNDGINFYRTHFQIIPDKIFKNFGQLVRAKYIFFCNETRVEIYEWDSFIANIEPIKTIRNRNHRKQS